MTRSIPIAVLLVSGVALAAPSPAPPASGTAAVASPNAPATPDPELAQRLDETRKQLADIEANLGKAQEKEKALLAAIDDLDQRISDKEADIETLHEQVAKAQATADEDRAKMEGIRAGIGKKKRWLAARVRNAFIHGRPGYLKVLFSAESYPELVRRTRFQAIVARKDATLVNELKRDLEEVAKHRSDYDQDLALFESMQKDAEAKTQELALERTFRQQLLEKIEGEKSSYQKLADALTASSEKLAMEIGNLQGGATAVVAPLAREPFESLRGRLHSPVAARVKLPYGRYKHPRLGLMMMNEGVTFSAPVGTDVHAVADGTVEMAGWFASYGQLLVVDHGDGWRSLYAHNSKLKVARGATVRAGDVIAVSGDTGSLEGPELFFAIFREGQHVDPADWITGLAKASPPAPDPIPTTSP